MQKKCMVFILLLMFIFSFVPCGIAADFKFSDVKSSDWHYAVVTKLVAKQIINGYPDGTFKPNNTITVAEFTKLAVTSLGFTDLPKAENWAQPYIDKAYEIGLIESGEFDNYNRNINRGEMARIIFRSLKYQGEKYDGNIYNSSVLIKDYFQLGDYKVPVLQVFSRGIVTGYPDGEFKPGNNATRAEASAMIMRMLDTSLRKAVQQDDTETDSNTNPNSESNVEEPSNNSSSYTESDAGQAESINIKNPNPMPGEKSTY